MKGRKPGQREITVDEINTIVELTKKGESRNVIAKNIGRCSKTVYLWQRKLL